MLAGEWEGVITRIGVTIRDLRHLCGWSQHELAERADTSQGTISRLETGHCTEIPLHSVVTVLRTLAAATRSFSIPRSPLVVSLGTFTDACLPLPSLTPAVDPSLLALIATWQRLLPHQRAALTTLLDSLTIIEQERKQA